MGDCGLGASCGEQWVVCVRDRLGAERLSVVLKERGLTVGEIVLHLSLGGYVNDRTGRPYTKTTVGEWCRGVFSQRGYRKPHLVGMSADERAVHDAEMRARQISRMRIWRSRHPDYGREYMKAYRGL